MAIASPSQQQLAPEGRVQEGMFSSSGQESVLLPAATSSVETSQNLNLPVTAAKACTFC